MEKKRIFKFNVSSHEHQSIDLYILYINEEPPKTANICDI